MPYNEELAARIRRLLHRTTGISERKMFGGLSFLRHGKMCCGIVGHDLMVRVLEKDMSSALRRPHVRPMDFTGKPLRGFVYVAPPGVATDSSLRRWVRRAIAFVNAERWKAWPKRQPGQL